MIVLRPATADDAATIARNHIRSWQAGYRGLLPDALLDGLDMTYERRVAVARESAHQTWVAERDGTIVGHASLGASRDADAPEGTGEVYAIYLVPEAWGKGVGRTLFTKSADELRAQGFARATLWVLDTNARARRFYEAAGWRADGAVKTEERNGVALREVRYAVELSGT